MKTEERKTKRVLNPRIREADGGRRREVGQFGIASDAEREEREDA